MDRRLGQQERRALPGLRPQERDRHRAAEGAADHVVRTELEEDGERRLFEDVTLTDRPGDEAFDAALRGLHRKLFSTEADAQWLSDVSDLWQTVASESSAENAWRAVVTVMLRDPAFLSY